MPGVALTTVQTSSSSDEIKNANNYEKESQRQDVGTALQAEGEIVLKAGQHLTATATSRWPRRRRCRTTARG